MRMADVRVVANKRISKAKQAPIGSNGAYDKPMFGLRTQHLHLPHRVASSQLLSITHTHNGILCFSLASVSNLGRVHERSCDEAVQEHKNTLGDAQETSPASCGGRCVSCQVSRVFTTSHRRAQHCTNQSLYHYRLHHHQLCRGLQLLAFVQARFTQKERSLSDRLPTTNNQQH
jgi:hypothetical protein